MAEAGTISKPSLHVWWLILVVNWDQQGQTTEEPTHGLSMWIRSPYTVAALFQKASILRKPVGSCTTFSNLASKVIQHHFRYILFIRCCELRPFYIQKGVRWEIRLHLLLSSVSKNFQMYFKTIHSSYLCDKTY